MEASSVRSRFRSREILVEKRFDGLEIPVRCRSCSGELMSGPPPPGQLAPRAAADLVTTTRPIMLTAIVDASHRADRGVTGIGIVLHATDLPGRAGPVIARIAEVHSGVPAGAIELFAVFRALEHARERGFRRVKVRSDYNYMRRQLKHDHAAARIADPDSLHGRTLTLARTFDHVVFGYKPRSKNQEAHRLARTATSEPSSTVPP